MIASPSDTTSSRDAVERVLHDWNDANAHSRGVVLLPWRWETSAVPMVGDHPQALINAQSVDRADILFALFGSRLGSPTPAAVSGTVEELERAVTQEKPVHLYFSTALLPHDVDVQQLDGLRAFKEAMRERSLYGEYTDPGQLAQEVWRAIEHDLTQMDLAEVGGLPQRSGASFTVQEGREREAQGTDKRGKIKYKTRTWLDVSNTGDADAEGLQFESLGDSGMVLMPQDASTTIHAGQSRRIVTLLAFGGADPRVLRLKWQEGNRKVQRDFHVG